MTEPSETLDYEVVVQQIRECPKTWLGAMLAEVVTRIVKEPFFKGETEMMGFIKKTALAARGEMPTIRLEYEIPPMRAIYTATLVDEGKTDDELRTTIADLKPSWRVRKLTRVAVTT